MRQRYGTMEFLEVDVLINYARHKKKKISMNFNPLFFFDIQNTTIIQMIY
jgi:hypothetical protein